MITFSEIAGLRLVFTTTALKLTDKRLFPVSRHRSARIHKKLVKRFGGEFRQAPAIYRVGDVLYVHPALRANLVGYTNRTTWK